MHIIIISESSAEVATRQQQCGISGATTRRNVNGDWIKASASRERERESLCVETRAPYNFPMESPPFSSSPSF